MSMVFPVYSFFLSKTLIQKGVAALVCLSVTLAVQLFSNGVSTWGLIDRHILPNQCLYPIEAFCSQVTILSLLNSLSYADKDCTWMQFLLCTIEGSVGQHFSSFSLLMPCTGGQGQLATHFPSPRKAFGEGHGFSCHFAHYAVYPWGAENTTVFKPRAFTTSSAGSQSDSWKHVSIHSCRNTPYCILL